MNEHMDNDGVRTIDEDFVREQAEKITESDIARVESRSEEIESRFLGEGPLGEFVEDLFLCLALVKDYATGRYRKIPYWAIGATVFMLLYIVDPIDLIPDYLIGIGQVDDLVVVAVCILMLRQELHHYKKWRTEEEDGDEDA